MNEHTDERKERHLKTIAVCLVLLVLILVLTNLSSFALLVRTLLRVASSILYGVLFAYLLNPLVRLADKLLRRPLEKLFKKNAQTGLNNIHSESALNIPMFEWIYHLLGFLIPVILLDIFAVIFKNNVIQLLGVLFEFPVVLLFMTIGVMDMRVPKPVNLAILIPYLLLIAGIFVLGFMLKIIRLKRQYADIHNELRTFDN